MTSHFVDKERAFVAGLEAETGHGLAAWMERITASGLSGRNDIIDWLRQQGFTFADASWLERIHHNSGRLIYASDARPSPAAARGMAAEMVATVPRVPPTPDANRTDADATPTRAAIDQSSLDAALAAGKAYRPLAQALLREILAAAPGAGLRIDAGAILFELVPGRPFACLSPGPKGVRLDLPEGAGSALLALGAKPVKLLARPGLTASVVLTDVRQIGAPLSDAIAEAARGTA